MRTMPLVILLVIFIVATASAMNDGKDPGGALPTLTFETNIDFPEGGIASGQNIIQENHERQNADLSPMLSGGTGENPGTFSGAGTIFMVSDTSEPKSATGSPYIESLACFGGSDPDYGYSFTFHPGDSKGLYPIIAGYTTSKDKDFLDAGYHTGRDAFIRDLGSASRVKCIGGSRDDGGLAVTMATDNGYILAGYTWSSNGDMSNAGYHGEEDAFVARLTPNFDLDWVTCVGGSSDDWVSSVQQTSDGGYIIAGSTSSSDGTMKGEGYHGGWDAFVAKLNPAGAVEWVTCIGGSSLDQGYSVRENADGCFILAGKSSSTDGDMASAGNHGKEDAFVSLLLPDGDIFWTWCYGTAQDDRGRSIEQTADGGYILAGDGFIPVPGAGYAAFAMKLDYAGHITWIRYVGGDYGNSVHQTGDGGYIIAGTDFLTGGYTDAFVSQLGPDGELLWFDTIGGSDNDYGEAIAPTREGGFVLLGTTNSFDGDINRNGYDISDYEVYYARIWGIPMVSNITPHTGLYGEYIMGAHIHGTGFPPGATACLVLADYYVIPLPNVLVVFNGGEQWIVADFSVKRIDGPTPPGSYDVVVSNPYGGLSGKIPGGFSVRDPRIGVFRPGKWHVDANGNAAWDDTGTDKDATYSFGTTGDQAVMGDWNHDDFWEIGVFRSGKWYVDANGNNAWDDSGPGKDAAYSFGKAGDQAIMGDWNRDGVLEMGVYRAVQDPVLGENGVWYVDYDGNHAWNVMRGDTYYLFGIPGDLPVTGDWNRDGIREIGVFRAGKWYVDLNANNRWDGTGRGGDAVYSFGKAGDLPVTSDWNNDGVLEIGVFRNGMWYLDTNNNHAWDSTEDWIDGTYSFGKTGDQAVIGDWGRKDYGVFV